METKRHAIFWENSKPLKILAGLVMILQAFRQPWRVGIKGVASWLISALSRQHSKPNNNIHNVLRERK